MQLEYITQKEGRGGSRAQGLFYSRRSHYTVGISLWYEIGPSERTPFIGLCAPVSDFVSSAAFTLRLYFVAVLLRLLILAQRGFSPVGISMQSFQSRDLNTLTSYRLFKQAIANPASHKRKAEIRERKGNERISTLLLSRLIGWMLLDGSLVSSSYGQFEEGDPLSIDTIKGRNRE